MAVQRKPLLICISLILCTALSIAVVQVPWYITIAATIALGIGLFLIQNPALALAIQCCGFYIALFGIDLVGIAPTPMLTAGFHAGLASCYLMAVTRSKHVAKAFLNPATIAFGFLVVWITINWYIFSKTSSFGITKFGFMLTMMLPAFIGVQFFNLEQFKKLRVYLILLGFIGISLAILTMFVLGYSTDEFGRFRVTPSANPLAFSYPLGISSIFMVGLALEKSFKYKIAAALMLASALFFIISTGSRGPLLSILLSILVILFCAGFSNWLRFVPISLLISGGVGFAAMPFIPQSALDRIYLLTNYLTSANTFSANTVSTDRLWLWQVSIDIWQRSPFTGVGIGNLGRYVGGGTEFSHNVILELLSETGVLGLAMFIITLIGIAPAFLNVYGLRKKYTIIPSIIGLFVFAVLELSLSGQLTSALAFWISCGALVRLDFLTKQETDCTPNLTKSGNLTSTFAINTKRNII